MALLLTRSGPGLHRPGPPTDLEIAVIGTLICLLLVAANAALAWYCIRLLARNEGWHR